MALNVGARLGHYEVTAKLGEGGMGEVWEAADTKLNRQVALKILPEAFAADPDRLARFQREAQVLASLNHPNIAAIHGIEDTEGIKALVLELVEGPTLADRIAQGPIPVDEALPIAKQIAEALEAAHEAGVIHRDLKPANIKVREDGTVKVLDFGLAKALDTAPEGDPSQSPTLTAAATQMGAIMGTAAYMSPEQARGKPVDKRADIWAFGAVVYEMLVGQKLFPGKDVSDTLAAVLRTDADFDALPDATPPRLRQVLKACLRKEPKNRVRDIGDAFLAMEGTFDTTITVADPNTVLQVWQRPLVIGLIALGTGAVGFAISAVMTPDPVPLKLARFTIVPPENAPLDLPGRGSDVAMSPDGTQVVYQSRVAGEGYRLALRPLDQLVGAPLRGTEGAAAPFFSADGEWVGFVNTTGANVLQKVSVFGGSPVVLAELEAGVSGASWGADNQIIFGSPAGLFRVSGDGGEPEALTTTDIEQGETNHARPSVISGREAVVFVIYKGDPLATGQLAVLDLATRNVTRLGVAGLQPHYVSTGHLVYAVEDGSVRAVSFDATSLEVMGNPYPVIDGVLLKPSGNADFSVSHDGHLAYVAGGRSAGPNLTSRLVVTGRDGVSTPLGEVAGWAWYPRFSPDGARVAFAVAQAPGAAGDADLWVLDVERGARTRVTSSGNNRFFPVWSPDGTQLAFADGTGRANRVLLASADGSGEPEILLDRGVRQFPMSWARDDSVMAMYRDHPDTDRDLTLLPLNGDLVPDVFLATPFQERGVSFSPDGGWLAYVSDESGQDEIYVRPYPGPGGQLVISTDGGEEAVWGRDGSELFYREGDQLMAVPIHEGESLSAEAPAGLFTAPYARDNVSDGGGNPNYDVSPDGAQFVFVEQDSTGVDENAHITVVLNWHQELSGRVSVP